MKKPPEFQVLSIKLAQLVLDQTSLDELRAYAESTGRSPLAAIREAVALERALQWHVDHGEEVYIRSGDGVMHPVPLWPRSARREQKVGP